MVASFEFVAESRSETGKGAMRRMRRVNRVPAVIYGGGVAPVSVALDHHKVIRMLDNEAVYSHILTVKVDGKEEKAILKDIQRHPWKQQIMHMDFQRVSESDKIRVHVPLHYVNQDVCVGVKKGGLVTHNRVEVEVFCLPQHLPEFIEIDMSSVEVGQVVRLSDLKVPGGVELIDLSHGSDHDAILATVQVVRVASAEGDSE